MAKVINSAEFVSEVKNGKGLVVVDFFATWCGPCSMLGPIFAELGEEMDGKAKFFKVDIDQSIDLAQEFGVSSVPTILYFKDGELVGNTLGFMPKERLQDKVESYL